MIYNKIPEGFEKFYKNDQVLKLNKTCYGLKQAAMQFYRKMVRTMQKLGNERSKADPCLYFKWHAKYGLILWVSWIDDNLVMGTKEAVEEAKQQLMKEFECSDEGELKEYVGCKLDIRRDSKGLSSIKFMQPVLIQSYSDEFDIPSGKFPITPGKPGTQLTKAKPELQLSPKEQTKYRSGVGKALHMMRWSRPETYNAVRDLARHMTAADPGHFAAMLHMMKYCIGTKNRGLVLKPNRKWNGEKDFKFKIRGKSDSNYATDPETRKSITGTVVYLEESPVMFKSSTQKHICLSVTEAEQAAGVSCAQDMLYVMHVLQSMGLQVELPMLLEIDNKGAVDLANNFSIGGRTRHVDVRQYFLRELKEKNILRVVHCSEEEMDADIFTKNCLGPIFQTHMTKFVSDQ